MTLRSDVYDQAYWHIAGHGFYGGVRVLKVGNQSQRNT